MHVHILNQTFYPDVAATAQHMWDLARHLDAAGHQVTAITSRSIYGTNQKFERARETHGNITIHRVPQTAFGKVHTVGRMADFLSFYASSFHKLCSLAPPDVILTLTSPPMIGALGMLRKQFSSQSGKRIALVNHVMDLYPDAAIAMGVLRRRGPIARCMASLTRRTLASCDAVIALGDDMRELLIQNYVSESHAGRIHVVQPWSDQDEISPGDPTNNALRAKLQLDDAFVLLYAGNFGKAHDVDTILTAIRATRNRHELRWCFTGGGAGMVKLQQLSTAEAWSHVVFLPYQPREALCELLNLADVHLLSQAPAFTGIVVPSKLFGILAAGKPSIMIGPREAEAARILIEHDAGVVVAPGDVETLLLTIDRLQSDADRRITMGALARRALVERYDRAIACQKIEQILLQAIEEANAHDR